MTGTPVGSPGRPHPRHRLLADLVERIAHGVEDDVSSPAPGQRPDAVRRPGAVRDHPLHRAAGMARIGLVPPYPPPMPRVPRQVAICAAAWPKQASIVRYNDMPTPDRVDPPLTTINIGHEDMGGQAAEIAAGERHTATTLDSTRLVLRGSTRRPSERPRGSSPILESIRRPAHGPRLAERIGAAGGRRGARASPHSVRNGPAPETQPPLRQLNHEGATIRPMRRLTLEARDMICNLEM